MEEKIAFVHPAARTEFFENVKDSLILDFWEGLYSFFDVPRASFQKYRYGKLLIPATLFEAMLSGFSIADRDYFEGKISRRPASWGASLGGKATQALHPELYWNSPGLAKLLEHSRKKAQQRSFDINLPLTEDLCEFLGAFIGDGFVGSYRGHNIIEISGDSTLDQDYLTSHLPEICKNLFGGLRGRVNYVKGKNAMRLRFHSKSLLKLLTERFKFPLGLKSHSVRIPEELMSAEDNFVFATIRGIFDTDGCVFFDKRKHYRRHYPRITFQTVSKQLYLQLKSFLGRYFRLHARKKSRREVYSIEIYGHSQLKKYLRLIGFSNRRHLSKCLEIAPTGI